MKADAFLGLDIGGTGAKAGVFDQCGRLLGFGRAKLAVDNQSESSIEEIYTAVRDAARAAVSRAGVCVRAMSVSSQGQTFAPLDKDGRPLHPAIMWYDARAFREAEELKSQVSAPIINDISTIAKIVWLKKHASDAILHVQKYLLLPDYISFRLTGRAVTDPNTASSTGFYAADAFGYSKEALNASGVEERQLAGIQPHGSIIGRLDADIAAEWGLTADTLLVTGSNDQYCGALGAGVCRPGTASETSGTCLAIVTLAEQILSNLPDGLTSGRFPIEGYSFVLAYERTAGLMLDSFREELCPGKDFEELDKEASSVPPGSRGIVLPSNFDGASKFTSNLSLKNAPAEIYRAILESLAFSMKEKVELMKAQGLSFDSIRSIGGGAKSNLWLQIKADILGMPIERPQVTEAASLGAAMIAASGAGAYASIAEASKSMWRGEDIFKPNKFNKVVYDEAYRRYLQLSH